MTLQEIKTIALENIFPHPDNPRKDLGDLTELTESIKKNGVLQNLTVMPGHYEGDEWKKDGYTLLIGHRRAAAARAAKLITVPCTVAHLMNRKEQVALMLEENMQRTDLTIQEQAAGFQMMLDLGDTIDDVAKKTGFSKQTVKHRIEIAKLDPEAIAKAEEDGCYQISISDYLKLEKLPTVEMRNDVLRDCRDGRQLDFKVRQKLEEMKRVEQAKIIEEKLKAIGIKKGPKTLTRWTSGYEMEFEIMCDDAEKEISAPADLKECIYGIGWNSVFVLRPKKETKKGPKELSEFDLKANYNNKRRQRMRGIQKEMEAKRKSFVLRIANRDVMPAKEDHVRGILETIFEIMTCSDNWTSINQKGIMEYHAQRDWYDMDESERQAEREMVRGMSAVAKAIICVDKNFNTRTGTDQENLLEYDGSKKEEQIERLKMFYTILRLEYGYVLDKDEKAILEGTHEIYTPWEDIRDDVMSGKMKI